MNKSLVSCFLTHGVYSIDCVYGLTVYVCRMTIIQRILIIAWLLELFSTGGLCISKYICSCCYLLLSPLTQAGATALALFRRVMVIWPLLALAMALLVHDFGRSTYAEFNILQYLNHL